MKLEKNGRVMAEAADAVLPDESDVRDMRQAHEAVQSCFDQAMAIGAIHKLGNISVRRDKKNGGYYAVAPVQTVIVGVSKRQQ